MQLKGKTILFLGSSVTFGARANGYSFADVMADKCGIIMIKEAVNGTTLGNINENSYYSRLKKIDKNTKIDLFICQLSTNDACKNVSFDDTEKGIRDIISYVRENFNCPIVFYTGTYFENERYKVLVDMILSLQKELNFYLLDLYNDTEMLAVSKEDYKEYMFDVVHPALRGYKEWWAPKFIKFCEDL